MELQVPWFESPFFAEEVASADLDDETRTRLKTFARDGVVVFDLGLEDFERIGAHFRRGDYSRGERVQDLWQRDPQVRTVACAPSVLRFLELAYGRRPFPFQTLNFPRGSQQRTHSDTIHFHCFPERFMAGAWVAFEDIDADNGPLHYYPGSHRLPCTTYDLLGVTGGDERVRERAYVSHYEPYVERLMRAQGLERRVLSVEAGQVLIWAANVHHGGEPILDPGRTRHTQVTHYYFRDCLYFTPMHSDIPLGRLHLRRPWDVATGLRVTPRYGGRAVEVEGRGRVAELVDRLPIPVRRLLQRVRGLQGRGSWLNRES